MRAIVQEDIPRVSVIVYLVSEGEENGKTVRYGLTQDPWQHGEWIKVEEGAELPVTYRFTKEAAFEIFQGLWNIFGPSKTSWKLDMMIESVLSQSDGTQDTTGNTRTEY